jgi:hypothetical protein
MVDARTAVARGRHDVEFFAHHFCDLNLHEGQLEYLTNAQATYNLVLTGNRWGKTTAVGVKHLHCQFYKLGAEPRYMDADGQIDPRKFRRVRYLTCHTAGLYETAEMVWNEVEQLVKNNEHLAPWLVTPLPRSKPHEIRFIHNGRWYFRTLGDDGEGIDGKSFYLITIDEAGWEAKIEQIINNVARMRVADVRGMVDCLGTAKPGTSQGFFNLAVQAQAYLGDERQLDHSGSSKPRSDGARPIVDPVILEYGRQAGYDLEPLLHAYLQKRSAQERQEMDEHLVNLTYLGAIA